MSAIFSRLFLSLLLLLLVLPARPANKTPVVTTTSNLSFGRFVAAGGGTVTISTAGVRTKTGGLVLISGAVSSAAFSLTESGNGKSLLWRNITLPTSATLSNGGATMTLNNFISDPPTTVQGTGRTDVKVGATMTVAPNQALGNYSGTFSVTVDYN